MPRSSRRTATSALLWQALIPVVRWPLHSPRRLAGVLGALVVLIWLFATLRPTGAADPPPGSTPGSSHAAGASPTVTATSSSPHVTVSPGTASPPPAAAAATASPALADLATRFVALWARPELPASQWQSDLIPLATTEFGAQLRTVLPANVPAHSVTGSASPGSASQLAASVIVPTDAGPVLVQLATVRDTWNVSGLTPASGPPARSSGTGSSIAATYMPLPPGA